MYTCIFFFFNDTATTEIYTLSLHDALPISISTRCRKESSFRAKVLKATTIAGGGTLLAPIRPMALSGSVPGRSPRSSRTDRKSTRLNSSHDQISYAVFCLKKKKTTHKLTCCQSNPRMIRITVPYNTD